MLKKEHSYLGKKDADKLYPIAILATTETVYKSVKEAFNTLEIKNKVLNSFSDFVTLASKDKCYSPNKDVPGKIVRCITEYPKVIVENDYYDEEEFKKMYSDLMEMGELKLPFPMLTIISGEKTSHDLHGNLVGLEEIEQDGEVNIIYTCFLTQADDGILAHVLFGKPKDLSGGKSYHVVTAHLGIDDVGITLKQDTEESVFGDSKIVDSISNVVIVALHRLTISGGDMYISAPTPEQIAVNKRRISKGKKPLIEFKLITIDGKKQDLPSIPHGTHASPRQHWRRGHWRTMKKSGKKVWVDAMLVGDEANGKIIKDYAVGQYNERNIHGTQMQTY
jgi:hypothetical protein